MGCNYYIVPKGKPVDNLNRAYKKFQEYIKDIILEDTCYEELIPEIHICKLSRGWKPVLHKTKMFSNLDELEHYLEINKDRLEIVDEYNYNVEWKELKRLILEKYADDNNILHSDYCREHNELMYAPEYTDSYGIEWKRGNWS